MPKEITIDQSYELFELITFFKKEYKESTNENSRRIGIALSIMEAMQSNIIYLSTEIDRLEALICQTGNE
jgi:polyhydroxyalkanoate synthesis regulator phasin